ncbi:hypothetical protein QCA50_007984 [Cerrena zonata]|uniref:Uncharacterized protein n=1 Tax=Cerrena zonata TaxID=2478898 RepID=A0AAW0G530_9APHY
MVSIEPLYTYLLPLVDNDESTGPQGCKEADVELLYDEEPYTWGAKFDLIIIQSLSPPISSIQVLVLLALRWLHYFLLSRTTSFEEENSLMPTPGRSI